MRSSGEVLLERVGRAELGKVLDHGEKARGYAAAIAVSSSSSSGGGGGGGAGKHGGHLAAFSSELAASLVMLGKPRTQIIVCRESFTRACSRSRRRHHRSPRARAQAEAGRRGGGNPVVA